MKFICPHCQQPTISLKQKFLTGKWMEVFCSQCGGRICAQPVILAVLYFFYVWDVSLFGYVGIAKQEWLYLGILVAGWIILDAFNLSCPLSRMKPKNPDTSKADQ